jgi:hypothetical protein
MAYMQTIFGNSVHYNLLNKMHFLLLFPFVTFFHLYFTSPQLLHLKIKASEDQNQMTFFGLWTKTAISDKIAS